MSYPLLLAAAVAISIPTQQRADPDFKPIADRPAYEGVHPVILVDGAHQNIHNASGTYKPWADLMRSDGYEVKESNETFTRAKLDSASLLVIANARGAGGGFANSLKNPFSPEEMEAVTAWVTAGGSLLFIADHAPMGSAAEPLAQKFGVSMSKGYVEDLKNTPVGTASDQGGTIVFSRENKLLLDHFITKGRPGKKEALGVVWSFTGQAIKGPAGSVAFMKLSDTAADRPAKLLPAEPGDPPGRNRIGIGDPVPLQGWAQGVAFAFGKGRVVVMGEAGMLSAQVASAGGKDMKFGMNVPGIDNKQLALNIAHWLSRLDEKS